MSLLFARGKIQQLPDLIFSLAKILVVGLFTTQAGIAEVVDWSVAKAIAYRQNEPGTAPTETSAWAIEIASAGEATVTPIAGGEFGRVNVSEPCGPAIVSHYFGSAP
ncbi:MAG: hypothetical protein OSB05_09385 [Akkermansiaceae bacterium]|nr:hypothetical protein [Akkermansiaceae bacterium]